MPRPRVREPEGVIGQVTTESYDRMMRRLMEKGYLDTSKLIRAGINWGTTLEVGPGPGYLGIDWLTKTSNTFLKGLDISADMARLAQRNATEFHVDNRSEYFQGDARQIVFGDETFDAVFSNGSLHEWSDPKAVLNEIHRVLKPGGVYYVSDLRRDMSLIARAFLQRTIPRERKQGFLMSLNASYTTDEITPILSQTELSKGKITREFWTIAIAGKKMGLAGSEVRKRKTISLGH